MILVLGGTSEARELADGLDGAGVHVTSSLAGHVSRPRLPAGTVRIGGFGGPDGLAKWLRERGVVAVVDATHPFAERISEAAASACTRAAVPLLRLQRPGWNESPEDVRRPPRPDVANVATVAEALTWSRERERERAHAG